jgi:hypothetical protein
MIKERRKKESTFVQIVKADFAKETKRFGRLGKLRHLTLATRGGCGHNLWLREKAVDFASKGDYHPRQKRPYDWFPVAATTA